MANDIFQFMQAGLGNLMSPRAARRMLTGALRQHRVTPESVTPQQMLGAVSGPLRQELRTLLPADVADRQVARLTRGLERRYGAGSAPPPTPPDTSPDTTPDTGPDTGPNTGPNPASEGAGYSGPLPAPVAEADPDTPAPPSGAPALATPEPASETTTEVTDGSATGTGAVTQPAFASAGDSGEKATAATATLPATAALADAASLEAAPEPLSTPAQQAAGAPASLPATAPDLTQTAARAAVSAPAAAPVAVLAKPIPARSLEVKPLDPRARDRLMVAFAQLEGVRMVALLGQQGEVLASRGTGFELPALSRLGTLALALLGRAGALRSFYLAQSRGQLFLFPFSGALLLVIGSPDVNLGQVFATLQKLKEDA